LDDLKTAEQREPPAGFPNQSHFRDVKPTLAVQGWRIRCGDIEHRVAIAQDDLVPLDHDLVVEAGLEALGGRLPHCLMLATAWRDPPLDAQDPRLFVYLANPTLLSPIARREVRMRYQFRARLVDGGAKESRWSVHRRQGQLALALLEAPKSLRRSFVAFLRNRASDNRVPWKSAWDPALQLLAKLESRN
jgi:hypothetical protein